MTRTHIAFALFVSVLFVLTASVGLAQPNPPAPPPPVPIDGGIGLLALAGGAYAARKLRRKK